MPALVRWPFALPPLMSGQIVQHDDIARAQRRHENVLDSGLKNLAVHGALMHEGCHHAHEAAGPR